MNPNKKRLRRTMMFLNVQKPGLIKDPYIYKPDSIMLDLEDAVAQNQKDVARFSLYHALQEIDYRGVERVVRINALDTPYWREDVRVCVAGGCDAIRIPKTESAQDVKMVEEAILAAEKEFGREEGSTLLMAAIESARDEGIGYLRGFGASFRNRPLRWRLYQGFTDPHYRNRHRTYGGQTKHAYCSQGSRCAML